MVEMAEMGSAPPTRASTLRRHWLERAFQDAGIDPSHWDPTLGVDVNRRTIERVYDYYGRLYLHHEQLEWAGMANMIGPSFYAGFLDLGFIPDRTRRLFADLRHVVRAGGRGWRFLRGAQIEDSPVADLGFFEMTFLTMQRKIFEDQALMHEAYLGAGLDGIRALGVAGIIDTATVRAWEQIDGGDPARVHEGSRTLLYREQHDIIDRFYVDMLQHAAPSGLVFTYLLTLAGTPAIPGAKSYPEVFPWTLIAPLSRSESVALRTPLASGNLALFANRWRLVAEDTFPAFQRLISTRLAEARRLIEEPIGSRAGSFRLLRRGGRLVLPIFTRWRLGLEATPQAAVVAGENVTLDLKTRMARPDAGFADGADGRIWGNPGRRPFHLSVSLPGGRAFSTDAVLAVLSSPEPGGNPTRLTVKLPATDLAGARRTLEEFAPEWQLDEAEIAAWAARAAAVTIASHVYSTRVFGTQPAGFVQLELQVEHHIEHDAYVVDALFFWDA